MVAPLPVSTLITLTFGVHIVLVNLDIALSIFIPWMKWKGTKEGDEFLVERAKYLMRYYAATYAVAGVFGTAFTVILLSFYPQFIGLAGHLTWVPFGLAILMIVLRFFSIVSYWYLWGKISNELHDLLGALLALTGLLVPLGFRAVFAFLNYPAGLKLEPKPMLDVGEALMNPTLWPLYLKSIFGALAAGSLVLVTAYGLRYHKSKDERYMKLVRLNLKYGLTSLVLMLVFGTWYSIVLYFTTPYKFANVFGFLVGMKPKLDFTWLFILKMVLVLAQLFLAYSLYSGEFNLNYVKAVGPLALLTVASGEMLNMHSQLPYFVAQPEVVNKLPDLLKNALLTTNVNSLANVPELYTITAVMLVPLLLAMAALFYLLLKD